MRCRLRFFSFAIAMLVFCFPFGSAQAQAGSGSHARSVVTQNIDEEKLVTLHGNTRPEAKAEHDQGAVDDNLVLEHMLLQLRRPAEQDAELQEFLEDLNKEGSPNFHRWISAHEFGERFGPSDRDLDKLTNWLEAHRFKVNVVYPSGMVIDFTGTAGQVRKAFHTEMHQLDVKGQKHFANMRNAQIPAALAPLVVGIVSLHNFSPHALHQMRHQFTFPDPFGGTTFALVPADLATIYNLNPLFNAGNSGQGQTIALIEDTDVFTLSDWNSFRSKFGLSSYTAGTISAVHPAPPSGSNNCGKPGVFAPNDAEAILDGEWASAAAPSAAIKMVSCADTNVTFGGLIAVQNLINAKSGPPAIMSISYGQCEAVNGAAANAAYNAAYQQAVAEGVSVFVAAGDSGAAGCDNNVSEAISGIAVNAFASTPYNVAVGGTDFSDTYSGTNSSYWNSSNTSTFGSALSYIPEIPWNDSCAGVLVSSLAGFSPTYGPTSFCSDPTFGSYLQTTVAGGGGPSGCATGIPSVNGVVSGTCKGWPKPSWQSVLGNPQDGVRDTPDVSLFAADGLWGHYYVFCWSDTANGGAACTGAPSGWSGAGGTSFASPIMAGIQALVNQRVGARQGNPNPTYYQLAATEYGSAGNNSCNSSNGTGVANTCVFNDVTLGDMDVNCTGNHNCYLPSGSVGVLSTSNTSFAPAYGTTTGWDFATGIGSINATNLVNNWPASTPIQGFALSASPSSLSFIQGASSTSTISVTPQGGFSGTVSLSASGLPTGVTASFNPTSTNGTSTLTLSASSAAPVGTATVTITGKSGSLVNTVLVSLAVTSSQTFGLSASPNTLSILQGTSGAIAVTITPQNGFTGSVSLSASGLPTGVTASFNPASTTGTSTLTLAAGSAATMGTALVTISGTSGSLTKTTTLTLTVVSAPLPSGWADLDIGAVGPAGSASFANSTFTVNGSGQFIWNTADGFNFAYQSLSGDGTIIARVLSASGGATGQSAGLMIRETLTPGSTNAYALFGGGNSTIYLTDRATTGGTSSSAGNTTPVTLPYWVKLARSGSSFTGYASPDGLNWAQVGSSQTITMAQNVFIGLAISSNDNTRLTTATFDNVSITLPPPQFSLSASPTSLSIAQGASGTSTITDTPQNGFAGTVSLSASGLPNGVTASFSPASTTGTSTLTLTAGSTATMGTATVTITGTSGSLSKTTTLALTVTGGPLPSGWADLDIGAVGPAGSATFSNGTFSVNGSGQFIWDTADGFNFAYQSLPGDGTSIARVLSASGGARGQSAGVMIREALSAGSTNAYALLGGGNSQIYLTDRVSTGGLSSSAGNTTPVTLPYWVKLVRSGSSFTAFASPDGLNWTQVVSRLIITLAPNVFIGLAISSNDNTRLTTSTFDAVSITLPAPQFSLSASPTSLSVTQGASGTSTVTVTPQNGFTGTVNLSASGLPTGVTASFNPASTTGTSTLTLTAGSTATMGTATVTITGTSGSLSKTTTLTLTVTGGPLPSGCATFSNGTFSVNGSGQFIWDTADGFNFAYQSLPGDGTIIARVLSASG